MNNEKQEDSTVPPPRLLIVAANHDQLYDAIKQALTNDPDVEVLVDRRAPQSRPIGTSPLPSRLADRREPSRDSADVLQRGWSVAKRKALAHRCPACRSSAVERLKPPIVVAALLWALGLRRYRCQPCKRRFNDRPLNGGSGYPR
jgi:hypothetical protein